MSVAQGSWDPFILQQEAQRAPAAGARSDGQRAVDRHGDNGHPVSRQDTYLERATGLTPPRAGTAEKQGFGRLHVDQSAQIYVDYEQDAPVARCRERRAVSPMAASASVDKALAGWRTRRRHTNRCNADRVSLVGGRR